MVFGGPYSNLEATRALRALATAKGIAPENCICTGDLVAYCARPNDTLAQIREWGCTAIMGNCEESLVAQAIDCGCGFEAGSACDALSIDWYRFASARVTAEEREWVAQLPRQLGFQWNGLDIHVTHGAPSKTNRFLFASSKASSKREELDSTPAHVMLAGHCGIPFGETFDRENGDQGYWLNSGAIGMPANDGTADGWYLLLEPLAERVRASWHRLHYDAHSEQRSMIAEGLDNGYARALTSGLWPSMDVLPAAEREQRGIALQPPALMIEPNH